jgi:hypothetical protein
MESLKMPLREVYKQYTQSEMTMLAWRSAEQSAQMHSRMNRPSSDTPPSRNIEEIAERQYADSDAVKKLEAQLGPIAYKLANEDGEVDMRKLTGDEAATFMKSLGFNLM